MIELHYSKGIFHQTYPFQSIKSILTASKYKINIYVFLTPLSHLKYDRTHQTHKTTQK